MKCYMFTANVITTVNGYVHAESEEEALEKIKNGNVDDIIDEDMGNDYSDIDIYDEDDEQ